MKKKCLKDPFKEGGQSFCLMLVSAWNKQEEVIKIEVKDNNVEQALRILKRKLQKEGFFKIIKMKSNYEKPSEKKKRIKLENIKRVKKFQRLKNRI